MKKIIAVLCLVFLAVCLVQGQEEDRIQDDATHNIPRYALGAGFTYAGNPELHSLYGGHLEFNIVLYRNKFIVKNNFILRAGGLSVDDVYFNLFTISEKILIERAVEDSSVFHIYFEGGSGIYGNEDKGFFDDTPAYTFGFGGGFSFQDYESGGFYFEIGYLGHKLKQNTPLGGVMVQTGYRIFF